MSDLSDPRVQVWLTEQTYEMLSAEMSGDRIAAIDKLAATGEQHGDLGVFAVCCNLADVIRQVAAPGIPAGDGTLTGTHTFIAGGLDDLTPQQVWVTQFVTAHANGDLDTASALFLGILDGRDPQYAGRRMLCLLELAATYLRCGGGG